jgi:hypothetical protein
MPSPYPDPNALRRDKKSDEVWTTLPAGGRQGDTPYWPLAGQSNREAAVWAQLWQTPQAVMWEANHLEWEVAFFVRRLVQAEEHKSSSQNATLVRQQMDSLGLSMSGMRSNRWKLSTDELGEQRLRRDPLPDNKYSARSRIKRAA